MSIMPDVVDGQLRLQFLGRDVMLPSVMASDAAHDPNAEPGPSRLPDRLPDDQRVLKNKPNLSRGEPKSP